MLAVRGIERVRAQDHRGHAVKDGVDAGLQALLMGGLPAGERAAEHFAQRRRGIAFMLGEGEQAPSGEVCITAGSVVGRPSASIRQPGPRLRLWRRATRVLPKAMALVA